MTQKEKSILLNKIPICLLVCARKKIRQRKESSTVIPLITMPRSKLGIAKSARALDHVLQQLTKNAGGGGGGCALG
jgi:hypothetical protein